MSEFNYPKVEQNDKWKIKLFDHQLTAIHFLEEKERTRSFTYQNEVIESNICIFADPTGYGKTLSVCGLLSRDKFNWDIDIPYHKKVVTNSVGGHMSITITKHYKFNKIKTSLLLVNQSIIKQWEKELNLLGVKYMVIDKRKLADEVDVTKYKLIITIPSMYNRLLSRYKDVYWKRFIFDEPININVPSMIEIKANFYLLITATPNQLRNVNSSRYHMLRNVFNWYIDQRLYYNLIVKNDLDYVKSSYVFPETKYITHKCYQPLYNMYRSYIDTETSTMISAGNILGAIRRLGGNETSNIFDLIKQKINYKIEQRKSFIRLAEMNNNTSMVESHNKELERLEKQMSEIKEKFTQRLQDNCSICLDKLEKPVLITCCQNIMCGGCILEWTKEHKSCPLCRTTATPESLIYIKKKNESPPRSSHNAYKPKTKPETIVDIIHNNKEGKFIIFSNYNETFANIHRILQTNHISYKELKGQTSSRNKIIDSFKSGEIKVLFLNSKNNGAGINLQEATDIILYHALCDDLQTQVVGRANRIGRKCDLYVHQLI